MGGGVSGVGWGTVAIEVEGWWHGMGGVAQLTWTWWLGPCRVSDIVDLVASVGWDGTLDVHSGYHV